MDDPVAARSGKDVLARLNKRSIFVALLVLLLAAPFMVNLAGDAQVHLAIAEAFADGRPFRFNPGGEIVVASTSPFWTMMLAISFGLLDHYTPALLSAVNVWLWLAAAYVLFRVARDLWQFRGARLWAVMLLWLGHTTIVANALGGLENVAGALQLSALYYLVAAARTSDRPLSARRAVAIGAILGWALLTRPDSGAFALFLFILSLPQLFCRDLSRHGAPSDVAGCESNRAGLWPVAHLLILILLIAAIIPLPWFMYQYSVTGSFLTDSSMARLYNGRMGAMMLIPDLLYLHPKALVSLGSAFLPLTLGFVVTAARLAQDLWQAKVNRLRLYREEFPKIAAVTLVIAGTAFYTFIVGAEAFGRYFLPLFPFFFLAGVAGLATVYRWLATGGHRRLALAVVALAALFLAATSTLDAYRRLVPGRFLPERALDVLYGPAHLHYYSPNVPLLVATPARRSEFTAGFLHDLSLPATARVSIAVTEVQLRYFLDERVTVLSLDGRTSANVLHYVNSTTGVPDFEAYFLAVRPDYVHANQWCAVGGWLATILPSPIEENLVCEWERRSSKMSLGDSFEWPGYVVTLVSPEILHIDWASP